MLVSICFLLALALHLEYRIRVALRRRHLKSEGEIEELQRREFRRQVGRIARGEFVVITFIYEVASVKAAQGVYCDWFQDELLLVWDKTVVRLLQS